MVSQHCPDLHTLHFDFFGHDDVGVDFLRALPGAGCSPHTACSYSSFSGQVPPPSAEAIFRAAHALSQTPYTGAIRIYDEGHDFVSDKERAEHLDMFWRQEEVVGWTRSRMSPGVVRLIEVGGRRTRVELSVLHVADSVRKDAIYWWLSMCCNAAL